MCAFRLVDSRVLDKFVLAGAINMEDALEDAKRKIHAFSLSFVGPLEEIMSTATSQPQRQNLPD